MNLGAKLIIGALVTALVLMFIWSLSTQKELKARMEADIQELEQKFTEAQDSIESFTELREKMRVERDSIEFKRFYWYSQYQMADSLLNRVKSQVNENLEDIHNADATKLNSLLSGRLSDIISRQ